MHLTITTTLNRWWSVGARALVTVGGVGYSPLAPGTCGTLVAVPLAWALRDVGFGYFVAVVVGITLVGIAAARHVDRIWGTHDSQRIVIDEVAGYLATVACVDRSSGWVLVIGFVAFRALDIGKPPPIRWIDDHVPGGAGVMLDDVAAGVMGAALMIALAELGAFDALARL